MEKIKAAIQKANKSRKSAAQAGEPVATTTAVEKTVEVSEPQSVSQGISYKKTRTVELDPAHLEDHRIIANNKSDPRSISFDMLRTRVIHNMRENDWRTLAITSPTGSCGKTVISINLSLSIAQQTERTVMLADFDLRKPRVSAYLGLPKDVSMLEYFQGKAELSDVMINPGIPRFTVLANSISVHNATETLVTNRMSDFVTEVRERYESRTVVFDLPPLLETDDAMAFIPQVDCVLLVLANGQTTASEIAKCKRLLHNTNVVGVVLNKSQEETANYYYSSS